MADGWTPGVSIDRIGDLLQYDVPTVLAAPRGGQPTTRYR
jgi:hypothetical protein